jgi:hypothetical protein
MSPPYNPRHSSTGKNNRALQCRGSGEGVGPVLGKSKNRRRGAAESCQILLEWSHRHLSESGVGTLSRSVSSTRFRTEEQSYSIPTPQMGIEPLDFH